MELDSQEFDLLIHYTRVNPLLMDIFVALRRLGDTTAQALARLSTVPSIPPFVERILERLEAPHRAFIAQLFVFRGFVPADVRGELDVAMLVDFNLIKQDSVVEILRSRPVYPRATNAKPASAG